MFAPEVHRQRAGGIAAFIDAEHALDPGWAKRLGVDLEALLVSQPSSGEEALKIAEMLWDLVRALALIQLASAGPVQTRDTVTAQVNFNNNTGTPQHLASGLLYGVPDTLNQIPVGFYRPSNI